MIGYRSLSGIILLVLAIVCSCNSENFPTSIKKCKHEDKKCLATVMSDIIKIGAAKGLPEIGLKPFNPYVIPKLKIDRGAGAVVLKIVLKNASILNLDCYVIDKVNGFDKNPRESIFELTGRCDSSTISGPYMINGKFLLLPVTGQGMSNFTFDKANFTMTWQTEVETRNGQDYLKINSIDYRVKIKRLHISMDNLFNNKLLSDNMNAIFNENDALILKEIEEPVQQTVSKIFLGLIQPVFDKFPYNELFAE